MALSMDLLARSSDELADSPSTSMALLWVVVTILCFGSQTVHLKLPAVRKVGAPWQLKMLFSAGTAMVGVMIAASLALRGEVLYSKWGVFTALVWTPGTAMMLIATHRIGIGLTIGLVSGCASLTSFSTGIVVLGIELPRPGLAALAILILLMGVFGLAMTSIQSERRSLAKGDQGNKGSLQVVVADIDSLNVAQFASVFADERPDADVERAEDASFRPVPLKGVDTIGISLAICAGILYGCQGLFLSRGGDLADGASMMMSQFFFMAIIASFRLAFVPRKRESCRPVAMSVFAFCMALLGGMMFGIGFIGQVLVLKRFGDAVGMPLTQANLVVAGIWSIAAFQEVKGKDLVFIFVMASLAVLCGVTLLAAVK